MAREYGFPPAAADIKTHNGMTYSKQIDSAFGTPGNLMSFSDVVDKFRECCHYSIKPIPVENQEKVIKMVETLEEMEDSGQIARLLG